MVAVVGAVGSLASGFMGSGAAGDAANAQAGMSRQALAYTKQQVKGAQDFIQNNLTSGLGAVHNFFDPYLSAGTNALDEYKNLLGIGSATPSQIQSKLANTPGYWFAQRQGNLAVGNQAAAAGSAIGGNALRAAANYTTGLADSTYGNQVNRYAALAGLGGNAAAAAAGDVTGLYGNANNDYSNITAQGFGAAGTQYNNIGNAQAAGIVGSANALTGGISGVTSILGQTSILNSLVGQNAGSGNSATTGGFFPSFNGSAGINNLLNGQSWGANGAQLPGYSGTFAGGGYNWH